MGMGNGEWVKVLLAEAKHMNFDLPKYHACLYPQKGALVIDARSVYGFLTTDSDRLPSDKRLAVDLRVLQFYRTASDWDLRWVAGPQQLADCLTKEDCNTSYLEWVLRNCEYMLLKDPQLESKMKLTILSTGYFG